MSINVNDKQPVYIIGHTPYLRLICEKLHSSDYQTVVVSKSCSIGVSSSTDYHNFEQDVIKLIANAYEVPIELLIERRYMVVPEIKKQPRNKKPWYQQTKGRRRHY